MIDCSFISCLQITQFLDSQGFLDYLERGLGSDENNSNLLDKLQDATGRGQNPTSILPSSSAEPEVITISDPDIGTSGKNWSIFWLDFNFIRSKPTCTIITLFLFVASPGSGAKYTYDRFPSNVRTEEQEEKRRQILASASGSFEYSGKLNRYIFMLEQYRYICPFSFHCYVLNYFPLNFF